MLRHKRKARALKKLIQHSHTKRSNKTAQGVHTLGCFVLQSH